ncbi:MAG: nickel-dependent hydrogenase large subunit [Beijerinckiaceae bacterium]
MSRLVVGPFNRVEGDLEVTLDIEMGHVREARVMAPLYRGFEQILVGRQALDSLVIAPRICGICSVSQSVAAAAALRALNGVEAAPNGLLATNIAHAAENIADHLTHFYMFFMPDFARREYAARPWFEKAERRFKAMRGTAQAVVLPARARLLEIMGILAGKWPHSLAFQPGGTTRAIDLGERIRLIAIIAEFRTFLEEHLLAAPLDRFLAIDNGAKLEAFAEAEGSRGDFATFVEIARDLDLRTLGRRSGPLLSFGAYHYSQGSLLRAGLFSDGETASLPADAIREDVTRTWLRETSADPAFSETIPDALKDGAYSWAKAPRLEGRCAEVGAVARQAVNGHPLIRDLLANDGGTNVRNRVIARVLEIALLTEKLEDWVRALRLKEPFCTHGPAATEGSAVGLVEAARGSLGHWLTVRDGRIARYQIIAPTTWNFSPRDAAGLPGPLEGALVGVAVGELGAKAAAIQHVVRSFDPCMVCTAH